MVCFFTATFNSDSVFIQIGAYIIATFQFHYLTINLLKALIETQNSDDFCLFYLKTVC